MSMDIEIIGADLTWKRTDYPGAVKFVEETGHATQFGEIKVHSGHIPTAGSEGGSRYIPAGNHTLRAGDAMVVLSNDGTWDPPSDDTIQTVRTLLLQTTNIHEFLDPGWSRVARFAEKLMDGYLPEHAPLEDTDQGWQQRYYHHTFGGIQRTPAWYHENLFRSDGYSNWHYNHLFWMGVRLVFENNEQIRNQFLWPYFLKSAMAHLMFGRVHAGQAGTVGLARDEKGQNFVGDSGRLPWEKQWVLNLVMPYLLSDRHPLFGDVLEQYASTLDNLVASRAWNGAWGVRIPARVIEDATVLGIVLPQYRNRMIRLVRDTLDLLDAHLERDDRGLGYWWPNEGNNGQAPASPWMACQAIAACFRAWEQLPETKGYGPTKFELGEVMQTILTPRGSETVDHRALLRYRYDSEPARFVPNSAWAVPALRYLAGYDSSWKDEYLAMRDTIQRYAGSTVQDVRDADPYPIDQIGFRFPREGAGWTKSMLSYVEALR